MWHPGPHLAGLHRPGVFAPPGSACPQPLLTHTRRSGAQGWQGLLGSPSEPAEASELSPSELGSRVPRIPPGSAPGCIGRRPPTPGSSQGLTWPGFYRQVLTPRAGCYSGVGPSSGCLKSLPGRDAARQGLPCSPCWRRPGEAPGLPAPGLAGPLIHTSPTAFLTKHLQGEQQKSSQETANAEGRGLAGSGHSPEAW